MLDAKADGWLYATERQVARLCLWVHAVATQGEVLQAEDVVPDALLRTLLCLSHVLVRLLQDAVGDESFKQGVDEV